MSAIGSSRFLYADQCQVSVGVGGILGMVSYKKIESYAGIVLAGIIAGFVQLAILPAFSGGFGGLEVIKRERE